MKDRFRKISNYVSNVAGSAWAFCLAFLIVGIWASSGSIFKYSDTWQLVINTGTTIVTFLMVFLIQATQNRDSKAMQIKLDELLRATKARGRFIDIEDLSDDELAVLASEFRKIQNSDDDNPTYMKFNKKLEDILTKRREVPSIPGKEVASQVVNILNPFTETGMSQKSGNKNGVDKTGKHK